MNNRTEYVEKLLAEMAKWDVQIERLKEEVANASPK